MNKWWYRHFKLEDCDDLGSLMEKYDIAAEKVDVMKNYFQAWKATYESNRAKKGTRGSVAGGVTPETRTDMENSVIDTRSDMENSFPVPETGEGVSTTEACTTDQDDEKRQVLPIPTTSSTLLEAIFDSKSSVSLESTSEKTMETGDEEKGEKKKKKVGASEEQEKEGKKKKSHKKRNKKTKKKPTSSCASSGHEDKEVAIQDEPALKKPRTEPATSVGCMNNENV